MKCRKTGRMSLEMRIPTIFSNSIELGILGTPNFTGTSTPHPLFGRPPPQGGEVAKRSESGGGTGTGASSLSHFALTPFPSHRMPSPRALHHAPVLPEETLRWLAPLPGETWVDCTLGGGGHARMILEAIGPSGKLFGFDQDSLMVESAKTTMPEANFEAIRANFDQLADVLRNKGIEKVDGVFADLGFSSDQLDDPTRGLSFRSDGPLDMRLDPEIGSTAADIVNGLSEQALADLFFEFGEERKSFRVAKKIVERRATRKFETTFDLANLVRSCVPRSGSLDPATRVFQALRIAVNDELGALERLLSQLPRIVTAGGRAGIISFHSLEDRRVKQAFRTPELWEPRTKKPVEASEAELVRNPRARSAKLRVAVRLG